MAGLRSVVAAQALAGLVLAGASLATVVAVNRLAHNRTLASRIEAWDLDRFRRGEEFFMDRGGFREFEDRLLVEEIPNADYSRGGVYFFGSSNLKWGLKIWELPAEIRPLVHNYGIGAVSHALEGQFLRFLIDDRGLLAAGGDRTHVVLGAFWSNALSWPPELYFGPLWRRHGLYTYTESEGIHVRAIPSFRRFLLTERARCAGFLAGNLNRLARLVVRSLGLSVEPTERLKDSGEVGAWVRAHYGSIDWRPALAEQMKALGDLLDDLKARGVGVTVALLPIRRAFDDLPLTAAYREEVNRVCGARSVEVVDLSQALPEDEFWDINHFTWEGLSRTHDALMAIASKHLERLAEAPVPR